MVRVATPIQGMMMPRTRKRQTVLRARKNPPPGHFQMVHPAKFYAGGGGRHIFDFLQPRLWISFNPRVYRAVAIAGEWALSQDAIQHGSATGADDLGDAKDCILELAGKVQRRPATWSRIVARGYRRRGATCDVRRLLVPALRFLGHRSCDVRARYRDALFPLARGHAKG